MNNTFFARNNYFSHFFTIIDEIPKEKEFFKIEHYDDYPEYEDIKEVIIQVDEIIDMKPDDDFYNDFLYYRIITTEDGDGGYDRFLEFFVAVKKEV